MQVDYFGLAMFRTPTFRWFVAAWCGVLICSCTPTAPGTLDEEKEPQFLIGRSRVNAMNFRGAIEAFEQALEMNPHSGAAHFELGWLYAEKEADPAAAIYHYQKYLKLRPNANDAETIRQHIFRLKQELAKGVLPVPATPELQRQLEQLVEEKRRLQEEVDSLRRALAQAQASASSVRADASVERASAVSSRPTTVQSTVRPASATTSTATTRTYRVQPGDTLASIARRNNIGLEALTAANPGLDPRRLQVGAMLRIPAR